MRFQALVLAIVGFSSGACAQELTAGDIQKSLSGKRVTLSCIDGTRGSGRYTMAKNFGRINGRYQKPGGGAVADAGQVRAEGNRLCITFKMLNEGREQCFGVRSTGQGKFA